MLDVPRARYVCRNFLVEASVPIGFLWGLTIAIRAFASVAYSLGVILLLGYPQFPLRDWLRGGRFTLVEIHESPELGNIVPRVFTPVLAKHSESFSLGAINVPSGRIVPCWAAIRILLYLLLFDVRGF
jgi:hypothetical protein